MTRRLTSADLPKLVPMKQPRMTHVRSPRGHPEADFQRAVVNWLALQQFFEPEHYAAHRELDKRRGHSTSFDSSRGKGIVLKCGTKRKKGDYQGTMQSRGVPDLWVYCFDSCRGVWLELKAGGNRLTPEQRILVDAGACIECRTIDDVAAALEIIYEKSL